MKANSQHKFIHESKRGKKESKLVTHTHTCHTHVTHTHTQRERESVA